MERVRFQQRLQIQLVMLFYLVNHHKLMIKLGKKESNEFNKNQILN